MKGISSLPVTLHVWSLNSPSLLLSRESTALGTGAPSYP
jgi:hypothetical protein